MLGMAAPVQAANETWTGSGQDRFWQTPANWQGGFAPNSGDSLFFGGTSHTTVTNNFPADTTFNNITFTSPAGAFNLFGSEVALGGNITNNQVVTPQTVNLPLLLSAPPTISVVPNGVLTVNGTISGANGLTVLGGGTVNLNGANPFSGGVMVNSGSTVVIGADTNLGGGNLVLNNGTLSVTSGFALSANRGIAVGPGWGGINVPTGLNLRYGGVIANNGGAGGLTKSGYGTNTLFGANTYSGTTSNTIGTLILDFTQPASPASGIINSSSSLELGGGNAGGGAENVAQLIMVGGAASDVQNFNGTFFTFGGSAIIATNRSTGSVNLGLGALSHSPGGTIAFVTDQATGTNHVTTTSPNVNGILGGYALISGDTNAATTFSDSGHTLIVGTNFAAVDGSGNIVNYNGYSNITASSTVASQVGGAQANISINDTAGATVVNILSDNAGATVDVNAVKWTTFSGGFDSISIGQGNTLRLGQFGGIIRNGPSTGNAVYIGGPNSTPQSGSGTTGYGNIGTLTAGGPNPNTPGEIVVAVNNASETSGTTIFESQIADNGTGAVTFVKMGPGSIKLDGHNTFSGGLYLLQGRVQFAGSEIGNDNADGGGFGRIFVLPGAYLFPSGIGTGIITNAMFVAGAGDAHEPLGAFRGGTYSGVVTLVGDATFGGNAVFNGPIVGPFSVTLGSSNTINGGATLNNPLNNWTGNTLITARTNTGANTITCGAANVIPNGFGYGNVTMQGGTTGGTVLLNLNGFNQTVNGLSSISTDSSVFIENTAAGTNATLTVGNNDQSGTFGGTIEDNGAQLALTKVGGGIETLTGTNTYSGATTVNNGTLAIAGSGSISNSTVTVNSGGTLDVTGASGFSTPSPIQLTGGTLAGNATMGALTMNRGALTLDLDPSIVNESATSLAIGGSSNVINISSVVNVQGYPTAFTIVQYAGALSGTTNFVFGAVPNSSTGGFITNDAAHSRIVLVLTNGPAPLTWVGGDAVNPTFWDTVTTNWLQFKGSPGQAPAAFGSADPVAFDDTGDTGLVSLQTGLAPGTMTVANNVLNYTFGGPGSISGTAGLVKTGSGTLTLTNTGNDSYSGGVTAAGGTIVFGVNNSITGGLGVSNGATAQVGLANATGTLPGGIVNDAGSVVFDRTASLTVNNAFRGVGSITKLDPAANSVLTLSGNNGAFAGPINVQTGTLQAGSGNALGTNVTTVSSGATLDVNGQTLNTTAQVIVSGSGISSQGAIINSGSGNQNALGSVTLANSTTFGGNSRWDIRGGPAILATSPTGSGYSLTKVGSNFIGIVNVTVDSGLGNIDIQQGTLDYEGNTSGLGNSSATLTVEIGATLELFNSTAALNKNFIFNGVGTNDTVLAGNGLGNTLSGPMSLNGTCVIDVSSTNMLTFANNLSGSGNLVKIGTGTNTIGFGVSAGYAGSTTVSNGTFVVDGSLSSAVRVAPGAVLAGQGSVSGNVAVFGGTVSPGDIASSSQATFTVGNLTLSNATSIFELSTTPSAGNDLLAAGSLTLFGTNTLQIAPLSFMSIGDTYTLVTYTGPTLPSSATNQLNILPPANGFFSFALVDPSTTPGAIRIQVLKAVGNDFWVGNNSTNWDTTTTNWTRNASPVNFNDGDVVTFDDSSSITNVNISATRNISSLTESAGSEAYIFTGAGGLTGVGGLNLNGISLTLANGSNSFTGTGNITFGGILQLGNGGTNGNVGSGAITNSGTIIFDRSDTNLTLANLIVGSGGLMNIGTGRTTLSGANTFDGEVVIAQGTLRVLSSTALGDVLGGTTVSNGATLDITNNANIGRESLIASGAGVNGNGAIINSSGNGTFVAANFSQLVITTNIVIGGSGRLDFRASSATAQDASLSTTGGSPSLTKLGTNQLQMAGVQIDGGLGDILVGGGILGFQWQMSSLGDSTHNLIVSNNASIAFFQMSNAVSKVLTLNGNASVLGQAGTANEFDGPTMVNGSNTFNISASTTLLFANELSGPGSLVKTGAGNLVLSLVQTNGGSEIYGGNTLVSQGTLTLLDNAALTNSPAIIMSNSTLVVTGRVDGTLNVGAAIPQTLAGGGVINGILLQNANSLVNPGNAIAPSVLTVSNGATLNGSVVMDLNIGAGAVTNDEIVAPGISVSGALTVTNMGANLVAGDRFQLFSVAVPGFTSVTLPLTNSLGNPYQWRNDLAVDGSITLTNVFVNAPTTNVTITKVSLSGTNLVIHGTNNNVPNTGFHYVVVTSTNMLVPLTNWTPVSTNSFNGTGTFDYTNPIVPGRPRQFLDVKAAP
jgi:autotransporter-associated beta strand protein